MPRSRETNSTTRSRPRQDCAYSPTGHRRVLFGRARASAGDERIHVAGREHDHPRVVEVLGHARRHERVRGPCEVGAIASCRTCGRPGTGRWRTRGRRGDLPADREDRTRRSRIPSASRPRAHRRRREARYREHAAAVAGRASSRGARGARATGPSCRRRRGSGRRHSAARRSRRRLRRSARVSPERFRRRSQREWHGQLGTILEGEVAAGVPSSVHSIVAGSEAHPHSQPHDAPDREPFGAADGIGVEHRRGAVISFPVAGSR